MVAKRKISCLLQGNKILRAVVIQYLKKRCTVHGRKFVHKNRFKTKFVLNVTLQTLKKKWNLHLLLLSKGRNLCVIHKVFCRSNIWNVLMMRNVFSNTLSLSQCHFVCSSNHFSQFFSQTAFMELVYNKCVQQWHCLGYTLH